MDRPRRLWAMLLKIGLAVMVLTSACISGVKVPRSTFQPLPQGESLVVEARPARMTGRASAPSSVAELFARHAMVNDTVVLRTDSAGGLFLELPGSPGIEAHAFIGTKTNRGYLELFLANDVKEIPPYFPIIYSRRNISRLRLALTTGGELVIDHKWANDGNIFLLAGGGSGRTQYFFRVAR